MSDAPSTTRATIDNGSQVDTPNTTVATPNSATAPNMMRPARRFSGWRASHSAITSAPTAGDELSSPRPHGPVCRMSRA
ncbi:hypothetical protein D3C72_2499530 [compost metagenome]